MATNIMACLRFPFLLMSTSMKLNMPTQWNQINMKCDQRLIQFSASKSVRLVSGIYPTQKRKIQNMLTNSLLVRILSASMD